MGTPPVDGDAAGSLELSWSCGLDIHLIDGTYELFRHYYALPSARDRDGREVAAVRGVLGSVLGMIRGGATHLAVALRPITSSSPSVMGFVQATRPARGPNRTSWPSSSCPKKASHRAGAVVWPMVEFEADDTLAAAAATAGSSSVTRVRRFN